MASKKIINCHSAFKATLNLKLLNPRDILRQMEEIFDNYRVYLLCVSVAVNLKTQHEFNFISLLSG